MKLLHKATGKLFDQSEFEELSFPNYQISSFKHAIGLITLRPNGLYLLEGSDSPGATLEQIFEWIGVGHKYNINSVKRLSDNVEFFVNE